MDSMTKNIADLLWCQRNLISIKATTSEKMGFTGREEGVAALATVILKKRKG
ncbi:MAG: hypothetical protein EH225_09305 [Calditrichaeota bacterium]|nr:2-C-methyl-D-erythritol 2,4-cyclodiphosphate synthase [Calditrichota bacterium]RQW01746.1 MAG: hypothetical protein EH225_09305 [Calditrichota bacterium]